LILVVAVIVTPACGGSSDGRFTDASSESGEPVRFEAADGVELAGRVFGDGPVASSWRTWAEEEICRRTSIRLLGRWPSVDISR
jgi:hypothetical protein